MNRPNLKIASVTEAPGESGETPDMDAELGKKLDQFRGQEHPASGIIDDLKRRSAQITEDQKRAKDDLESRKTELAVFDEDYHRRRDLLVAGIDGAVEQINEISATLDETGKAYRAFQNIANAPQANTTPVQGRKVAKPRKAVVK